MLPIERLLSIVDKHPDRPALVVDGAEVSYAAFWRSALLVATAIHETLGEDRLVGFFAERDPSAYRSVAAILAAGCGYTPLSPKLPDERLRTIIMIAKTATILVGTGQSERLAGLLRGLSGRFTVIELDDGGAADWPDNVRLVQAVDWQAGAETRSLPRRGSDPAYLLFTSGSTGVPKGVPVSHDNLCAYLDHVVPRYRFGPDDRMSQTFELTFDLSVHDMMCAWTSGAALVPFTGAELIAPSGLLRASALTVWFSVPSLGVLMERSRSLKSGIFPRLRVSLFCGEPLTANLATAWQAAAPNSNLENLYGPTEATIAFTGYRWDGAHSLVRCRNGLVPIGVAFGGQRTRIHDSANLVVQGPGRGELLLGGSQVASGYWQDEQQTAEKFLVFPDCPGVRWYRSGDEVERDSDGVIHFIGRLDHQVKVRGYRIELSEIEAVLRDAAGTDLAVVVPFPVIDHQIKALTAVISQSRVPVERLREALKARLPSYMVPAEIRAMDHLPRSLAGKIDRNAIIQFLAEEHSAQAYHAP